MSVLSSAIISVLPGVASILSAVVALGILIFAHEFGHFIVAKLSGVSVLRFSLGFGRKLVGWKVGETEYMVSAIPLGGYVKMLGGEGVEEEGELTPEELKRSFMAQRMWKRMAIVFAGPLFNVFLAIALCYIIFITGYPTAIAKVAEVTPGSPAQVAGFRPGDIVQKVGGEYMDLWEQVVREVEDHPGKVMDFTVRRGGGTVNIKAAPAVVNGKGDLGLLGSVVIAAVMVDSPADRAGIKAKDRVVSVNGRKSGAWEDMSGVVKANPGRPVAFTIERDGKLIETTVTPKLSKEDGKDVGKIGVQMGSETEDVAYGPVESVGLSVNRTMYFTGVTVTFLSRLIKGKEDASQLGGPVAIVQISGRQARQGFADFVIFMALLSVNLGIMNLFPIPILDGGLLFIFAIEAVLGKPLSIRKREIAQQFGLVLLVALMVFVFYNDFMRLLGLSEMWK